MLGTILGIEEIFDVKSDWGSKDGYKVITNKHTFQVLISNGQSCCESWGYFSSEDDLSDYVGTVLYEINLTDTALNTKRLDESDYYHDDGGIQFVDFSTSSGVFQLAVYNAHNGYYGHSISVLKDQDILLDDSL